MKPPFSSSVELCTSELNPPYFELVLRTQNAVVELKRYSRGITDFRLRLYWEEFKNILVPVPPSKEINSILTTISAVNSRYDNLMKIGQNQIDLLERELKFYEALEKEQF